MNNKTTIRVTSRVLLLILIVPTLVFAQLNITSPSPRAVYQRDVTGQRSITISGTYGITLEKLEVRAVPVILGQGVEIPWKTLQVNPKGGVFNGDITLFQGWYTIEVRGTNGGNIVARDVLERLGVGEVFIISGQSNAQGLKKYPGPGATDDRVIYITNYNNDGIDNLNDPLPPKFEKIATDLGIMSPRGQSAWCWGILGDLLVKNLNVPVLFINTAWEGTAIENWAMSARGLPTKNKYGGFTYPPQMPYGNLRIAVRNYASQYGVRGILWMQGETDARFDTPSAKYRDDLLYLIDKLGSEIGKRIMWVVARTSRTSVDEYSPSFTNQNIIAAQNAVIDIPFYPTYRGPETDPLAPNRLPDGTHFVGEDALTKLAYAWYNSLDAEFFSRATPLAPISLPLVTAACVSENNAVTITLPSGYNSYSWNTGSKSNSITVTNAGKYQATVKDAAGNSILSQIVVLENNAKPATPSLIPAGDQQACADSTFTFAVNPANDNFLWFDASDNKLLSNSQKFKTGTPGEYFVQRQNIFGCISEKSSKSKLVIRPKISKPVIESSGPFSITASIAETGLNEQYIWRIPGAQEDIEANILKVLKSGDYVAQAKVNFKLNNSSITCYSDKAERNFKTNEKNEVVIYPNPSQGRLVYIESRDGIKDAEVTLFDLYGRVVGSESIAFLNSRTKIDVSHLAIGVYIIRITGDGQSITKQIIIR